MADLLVETLVAAGVQRIYGVAGDSLNASDLHYRRRVIVHPMMSLTGST